MYKVEDGSSLPRRLAGKYTTVNGESKAKTKAGKPLSVAEFPIETVSIYSLFLNYAMYLLVL
jgi:hypothetical protein